jgi:hypothetical protein
MTNKYNQLLLTDAYETIEFLLEKLYENEEVYNKLPKEKFVEIEQFQERLQNSL